MKYARNTVAMMLAVFCSILLYGQGGNLDLTFGTEGKLVGSFLNGSEWARATAIQPDGKIVVVGFGEETHDVACLARYNTDGSLDNTFGNEGKVIVAFPNSSLELHDLAIQPDGKIVAAGWIFQALSPTGDNFLVMRFLANGEPDPGFGINGKETTDFVGISDRAYAMFLRLDGKIVLAGYTDVGPEDLFALARYLPDGTLDNTFDADGRVMTEMGGTGCRIFDVASQSDGKIVVAGFNATGTETTIAAARYAPTGSLDLTFSGDGKLTVDMGAGNEVAHAVAIQSDGKVVIGATSHASGTGDFALVRLTTDGNLDGSFDTDGQVTTDFFSEDAAVALKIQTDGKLVLAGWAGYDLAVARYLTNGALDNTFSFDGMLTTSVSQTDQVFGLALQSDGKIIATGSTWTGDEAYFLTVRYLTTGALDNSFNDVGHVMTAFVASRDVARAVVVQSDNKILAAGASWENNDWDFALARCLNNGLPDYSFGYEGMVTTNFGNTQNEIFGALQQSDGKIVVAGYIGDHFGIARYLPDGEVDATFGTSSGYTANQVGVEKSAAFALTIQPDGKLVAAGFGLIGGTSKHDFAVVRYNTDGHPDPTFGYNGTTLTSFGLDNSDDAFAVAVQPDGRIVAVGSSYAPTGNTIAAARYLSDGSPDWTFGIGGKVLVTVGGMNDVANGLVLLPDGKMLLSGQTETPVGDALVLVRLNADGTLDNTFDGDGIVTKDIGAAHNSAIALALQQDGKIVTAGFAQFPGIGDFAVCRFLPDGTTDNTFGAYGHVLTDFTGSRDIAYAMAIEPSGKIIAAGQTLNYGTDYDFAIARYMPGMLIGVDDKQNNMVPVAVYPNPITEQVTVSFTLTETENLSIRLYHPEGRLVQVFAEKQTLQAGDHQLVIRPDADLPVGVYTLLVAGKKGQTSVKLFKE